ncbi:MAG: hypothetical protein M1341_04360 [Candidatus Thermoplasmatota archaeon]|jgi:hypothetical protein|nr:hypothetical protein [Candidatus Thermoplasmatota archaeon]
MIIEDHRNISCGGDPFNYLKSVLKSLQFSLEPGQEAMVQVLKEKFPYEERLFDAVGNTYSLKLVDFKEHGGEVDVIFRRANV